MARRRASMREGPLAELFRATEAAQRQAERAESGGEPEPSEADAATVEIRGILPTMYDGRTLHSKEAVEMLKENFGDLVYETRIKKTVRYAEAPVEGSSVLKYDSSGPAAKAYRDLAKEVLNGATPREHA